MQNTDAPAAPLNGSYSAELKPDSRKPRDVLRDTMHFYDKTAKDIITDIILRLKEENGRGTGSELAMMYKRFHECTDIAIRCAEKLAPYEHPKLESIEVKKELTHRFVLRAPPATIDTKEWLTTAQKEQKMLASKAGHELMELEKIKEPPASYTEAVRPDGFQLKINTSVTDDPLFPDEFDDDDDDYSEED